MRLSFYKIIMICVLCFGFKAQAQNLAITEYHNKLESLATDQSEELERLVNGAPRFIFMDGLEGPSEFERLGVPIEKMLINNSDDFMELAKSFPNALVSIKLLEIVWNGNAAFQMPKDILRSLTDLRFVYIRSYEELSIGLIQSNFQNLLQQLEINNREVEVLYYTMEQPQ